MKKRLRRSGDERKSNIQLGNDLGGGREREIERFNVFKVNHVNLIDLTSVNKCSMKNRTLLKSTIDQSIEQRSTIRLLTRSKMTYPSSQTLLLSQWFPFGIPCCLQ